MATPSKATQEFVPIEEVRDGIVVLKDGGLRALVLASSLNFALKSQEEQEAIIFQFQNFLNSLDFTIQMFIHSRRLDIKPYLATLDERYRKETGDLMKNQIKEYIEFIRSFTENTEIMTKNFFVVIPYTPSASAKQSGSALTGLFGPKKAKDVVGKEKKLQFEEYRTQIDQRVNVVKQGLTRLGVRAAELGTEEIVELYYKIFNPGETTKSISLE